MTDAPGTTVLIDVKDDVATITLNRPQALNAVHRGLFEDFERIAAPLAQRSDIRFVVLTGAGRGFCAGGDMQVDVGAASEWGPARSREESEIAQAMVRRIRALPQPVIARVNGVAVGAGFDIAISCDLIVAADTARFGAFWVRRGIVPDMGGTWTLPRLVGLHRARELIYTARLFDAAEAERMGLVNLRVAPEQLDAAIARLCDEMRQGSARAIADAKQMLNRTFETGHEDTMAHSKLTNITLLDGPEHEALIERWKSEHAARKKP